MEKWIELFQAYWPTITFATVTIIGLVLAFVFAWREKATDQLLGAILRFFVGLSEEARAKVTREQVYLVVAVAYKYYIPEGGWGAFLKLVLPLETAQTKAWEWWQKYLAVEQEVHALPAIQQLK